MERTNENTVYFLARSHDGSFLLPHFNLYVPKISFLPLRTRFVARQAVIRKRKHYAITTQSSVEQHLYRQQRSTRRDYVI